MMRTVVPADSGRIVCGVPVFGYLEHRRFLQRWNIFVPWAKESKKFKKRGEGSLPLLPNRRHHHQGGIRASV